MAIWQFYFVVIPQEKILPSINTSSKIKITDDEGIMSWRGYYINQLSLKKLSEILKYSKSWTDNIVQFGSVDGTCVELYYENETLIELSVRLDLRNIRLDILEVIIDFIKINNAMIVTRNGDLIKPIIKDIIEEIKKSDAYSFVKNPDTFLCDLK